MLLLCFALALPSHADVFQWSVPIESLVSSETKDHPRAWLYIPPSCKRVRAVVVGQHNLLEETIFDNAVFRQSLADNDMAVVWVSPAFDGQFHPDKGAGEHFNGMMKALAQESGYSELEWAPVIPIGHSAMAGYPYQFAAWAPERTLVAISIKGNWPDLRNPVDYPFEYPRLNGVPLLYIGGEYEDANGRAAKAANFRKNYPLSPLTMVADVGAGHFDFHDRIATYMALYLREVAKYRLPQNAPLTGPVTLKAVDPTQTGWFYDRWRRDEAPNAPPAPIGDYTGPREEAFWAFNGELAKATNDYTQLYQGKKPQLLGYIQNGEVVPQNPKAHEQVQLKVLPEADGTTFKIGGTFIDSVPEGRPPGWTGLPVGSPITHATDGGPIDIEVTTGPLRKIGPDTFVIRFGKTGFNNTQRGRDIWFQETQDGGTEYKRVVQQAALRIPLTNGNGADQTISFPEIPNQKNGAPALKLNATSSAGVPVYYYVEEGPALIENDDTLRFTPIPPRAKMPVKVTVVAYQWGRSIEPKLKSAAPVVHTFYIGGAPDAAQVAKDSAAREAVWKDVAQKVAALTPAPVETVATPAATVALLPLTAANFGRALSFNFAKNLAMEDDDLGGEVVRVAHWNNLLAVQQTNETTLDAVADSNGQTVPRLHVSVVGGATSYNNNSFDAKSTARDSDNDSRLFNGAYDQNDGTPTSIEISGIPYAHYDVIFYRVDDGAARAGKFTVGGQTLYARGGKPNPDSNGANYLEVFDNTQGAGSDIGQGNVIRFANLSGSTLNATFQAVNAGDDVQRNKVAGFQIVERK